MLPLGVAKLGINIVSALGVTKVVGDIIRNNTTVMTTSQKYLVNVGGIVLSSMIVDKAVEHVNETIDKIIDWNSREKQNS